jgi:hypothetical protein
MYFAKKRIRILAAMKIPNLGHNLFYSFTVFQPVTHRVNFETLKLVRYTTVAQLTTGYP